MNISTYLYFDSLLYSLLSYAGRFARLRGVFGPAGTKVKDCFRTLPGNCSWFRGTSRPYHWRGRRRSELGTALASICNQLNMYLNVESA